jgi:murein DD-endopeptidase MepM/ murein hydrolase activator NlpD
MRVAFGSKYGRGAGGVMLAAGLAFAVAGCSSNMSRFDMPSLNLTESGAKTNADLTTTASLPVPSESIYSPERYRNYGASPRSSRPPAKTPQTAYAPPRTPPPITQTRVSGPRIKVQSGDTLESLSNRYGVPINTIQSANNLPDGRLHVGQTLVMPGARSPAAAQPRVASNSVTAGPGETVYTVRQGDTPATIAHKLGANQQSILVRNDIRADALQVGQKLIIPTASSQTAAKTSGARKVKTTTIMAPGAKPAAKKTPIAASEEVTGGGAPKKIASGGQLPSPDALSGASFRWPVKGRIVSGFGTKPDGGHNDGVNISVPQGTSVKAAENGVVAYAGSELKGYGNLVLVRHANNWVSAYANNEEILVKRGDKVKRGQVIAKAGMTGSVSKPQVHFELRKGSRPVDPTKYLSSMAASAN